MDWAWSFYASVLGPKEPAMTRALKPDLGWTGSPAGPPETNPLIREKRRRNPLDAAAYALFARAPSPLGRAIEWLEGRPLSALAGFGIELIVLIGLLDYF